MRIALFSPLNPVRTGIADYTEEMLAELSKYFEIDLYIDRGYTPQSKELLSRFNVVPFHPRSFNPSLYKEIVYHMGNYYKGHRYIYESLKRFPGIVVLHDYVLQGFYAEQYDATGDFHQYREFLEKYYSANGTEIAQSIAERSAFPIWESSKALDFPLNEEIIEYSKALIVHSDFVLKRIKSKTKKPAIKIYHHGHVLKSFDAEEKRKELEVKNDELLICSAGFVNKNKRYDQILAALDELHLKKYKYVIAGKDRGSLVNHYLERKSKNILVRGHLPLRELEELINASDICINLRFPTMGESSGSLLRMLGYAKPTLITNYGSYAEFPDYCALKVDPDIDEKETIKRFLQALVDDKDFRSSIGREAKEFVQKECGIDKCARAYAQFIKKISGGH